MSVSPEFSEGVDNVFTAEAGRMMDGFGNGYQAFLTGAPIYMADRGIDNPEWFSQETLDQSAIEGPEISGPEISAPDNGYMLDAYTDPEIG